MRKQISFLYKWTFVVQFEVEVQKSWNLKQRWWFLTEFCWKRKILKPIEVSEMAGSRVVLPSIFHSSDHCISGRDRVATHNSLCFQKIPKLEHSLYLCPLFENTPRFLFFQFYLRTVREAPWEYPKTKFNLFQSSVPFFMRRKRFDLIFLHFITIHARSVK